jgi:signal transduction histidine kinase/ActR/RegA family two-component response regulator
VQQALAEFAARQSSQARWLASSSMLATLVLTTVAGAAWWLVANRSRQARMDSELALAQLRSAAAEQASRHKSRFVADISHELRTPLTAILGYTELLADPGYPASARGEAVATVLRHGRHLLEVVNDLLDVAKLEAGQLRIQPTPTEPVVVVEETASLMRIRAHDKGLALRVEYATAVPRVVVTEGLRLRQILVNLVGNAIKFTDRGEVRMVVRCDAAMGRLCVAVVDQGVGMNEAQVARLFHDFAQVDDDVARRGVGTGLGLALSQRLAALLGGGIEVRSEPGCGSTFTLWLPIPDLATAALWRPEPAIPGERAATAAAELALAGPAGDDRSCLRGRRILLAEDGRDNQRLVAWLLERAGAAVTVVGDGRQAVDAMATGTFDLVLMDMQMPVLDGYRATQRLREQGATLPIVALTANAMSDDRARCQQAGCNDYVSKPIDRRQLLATCTALCAGGEPAVAAEPLDGGQAPR